MATGFTIAADTFSYVNNIVETNVGNIINTLSNNLSIVFLSALYLYGVYVVYNWFTGHNVDLLKDGIRKLVLLGVICTLSLNTDYYISHIVPIILNLGDDLGRLVTHSTGNQNSLDIFMTQIYSTIKNIWAATPKGISDIGDMFMSGAFIAVIGLTAGPFVVASFAILLTAKIMVALLLSVGTIFIAFAMFPTTRSWFQQWVGLAWNYTLISLMFPIALALMMGVVDKFIFINGNFSDDMASIFKLGVTLAAFTVIAGQIPVLASSLSGGVGINGMASGAGAFAGTALGRVLGSPFKKLFGRGNKGNGGGNNGNKNNTKASTWERIKSKFGNNIRP
ncbi:type IV secretion system protein (plasmid) [Photobacterium leiognathi subsp. mandapamensis]|uniref:type IV secretion system protein n=1 Tax=Photobacterium leiognathi TaxID=553611 RepID=UPI003AF3C0A2